MKETQEQASNKNETNTEKELTDDIENMSDAERELIENERSIAAQLMSMVNALIDMALDRFTQKVNEELGTNYTQNEALSILEQHPELLNPEVLDEAINYNARVSIMISLALSFAGTLLKNNPNWYEELKSSNGRLIVQLMYQYRPDLYNILKDKPNVLSFIINYVLAKLGVV